MNPRATFLIHPAPRRISRQSHVSFTRFPRRPLVHDPLLLLPLPLPLLLLLLLLLVLLLLILLLLPLLGTCRLQPSAGCRLQPDCILQAADRLAACRMEAAGHPHAASRKPAASCRPQAGSWLQAAGRMQAAGCRPQAPGRLQHVGGRLLPEACRCLVEGGVGGWHGVRCLTRGGGRGRHARDSHVFAKTSSWAPSMLNRRATFGGWLPDISQALARMGKRPPP